MGNYTPNYGLVPQSISNLGNSISQMARDQATRKQQQGMMDLSLAKFAAEQSNREDENRLKLAQIQRQQKQEEYTTVGTALKEMGVSDDILFEYDQRVLNRPVQRGKAADTANTLQAQFQNQAATQAQDQLTHQRSLDKVRLEHQNKLAQQKEKTKQDAYLKSLEKTTLDGKEWGAFLNQSVSGALANNGISGDAKTGYWRDGGIDPDTGEKVKTDATAEAGRIMEVAKARATGIRNAAEKTGTSIYEASLTLDMMEAKRRKENADKNEVTRRAPQDRIELKNRASAHTARPSAKAPMPTVPTAPIQSMQEPVHPVSQMINETYGKVSDWNKKREEAKKRLEEQKRQRAVGPTIGWNN